MKESWHKTFVNITKEISTHSTCCRKKLGAILVKDKRIISIGYNGVASGQQHCEDYFFNYFSNNNVNSLVFREWIKTKEFYKLHGEFSNENEIHAETNCIGYAAKEGIKTEKCIMFVSLSPCMSCAKLIVAAGIKAVYYIEKYDRDPLGIDFLEKVGIECEKIND